MQCCLLSGVDAFIPYSAWLCIYTFAMSVAASVLTGSDRLLALMADDLGNEMLYLQFGDELVPMQLLIAKQWSKVLATAIDADAQSPRKERTVIPMTCSKDNWLLAMSFGYPIDAPAEVSWDNLEVSIACSKACCLKHLPDARCSNNNHSMTHQ